VRFRTACDPAQRQVQTHGDASVPCPIRVEPDPTPRDALCGDRYDRKPTLNPPLTASRRRPRTKPGGNAPIIDRSSSRNGRATPLRHSRRSQSRHTRVTTGRRFAGSDGPGSHQRAVTRRRNRCSPDYFAFAACSPCSRGFC
jgi:hypothetical protein